jgi:hypothetical protein
MDNARYFETGSMTFLIWFVASVELAAHTKGSGLAHFGAPISLAVVLRWQDECRKWRFRLLGNSGPGEDAVLIASYNNAEGMLVSEMAQSYHR